MIHLKLFSPLKCAVAGMGEGGGGSSGDLSSGPASLGSGDEGSGASLGGSQTSLTPPDRSRRAHMWQTAPVVDWTKEQVEMIFYFFSVIYSTSDTKNLNISL